VMSAVDVGGARVGTLVGTWVGTEVAEGASVGVMEGRTAVAGSAVWLGGAGCVSVARPGTWVIIKVGKGVEKRAVIVWLGTGKVGCTGPGPGVRLQAVSKAAKNNGIHLFLTLIFSSLIRMACSVINKK
jgi:hypothetical protein